MNGQRETGPATALLPRLHEQRGTAEEQRAVNRNQSQLAQSERAAIRAVLASRRQDEPLFTPKEIARALGWSARRLRAVQRHVQAIRTAGLGEAPGLPRSTAEALPRNPDESIAAHSDS